MSGGLKLPVSHCETENICGIQFGVYKASQLKQFGVCHVTSPISYTINGDPIPNGLADRKMGSTELRVACETCAMEHPDCPGHFGYTELAEPVFNIGLFDVTYSVLGCVCQNCGALLAPIEERHKLRQAETGLDRLRMAKNMKKSKCEQSIAGKCCGAVQALIRKPPPKTRAGLFFIACRDNQETPLYASDVYRILNRVTDEDAILMGFRPDFCHPRDLIMTVLPIPPPAVRPGVSFGSARSENELTVQLASVLKVNEKLRNAKDSNAPGSTLIPDVKRLQELIAAFINNASTYYNASKLRGKLPLKSLTERLKGKQGRLRGYLMGKRVDFSARTVITGDPTIDVDQVGVPRSVAMTLTFPEKVNHANRKSLTALVQSTVYPSANFIIHKNGAMRNLTVMKAQARKRITLEIGDTVERQLKDGDPVLFNRQPTLHRMSMMGHRAKILPFNTFRLNLTCTTPYNADFDGDEMNLHVPQSLLTKAELMEIMMVTKNFVTPNKSQPCMGIVQDSLLGCFRVTDRETFLDKYFMQCVLLWLTKERQVLPVPAILRPVPLWTGKQLFSLVLPEVNVGGQSPHEFKHDDSELVIRRGQLISGMISKSIVGVAAGSLIHVIYNEKGADEVVRFVNAVQRTTAYYLYNYSFSVGIQDTIVTTDTLAETDTIMRDAEFKARAAAAAVSEGSLKKKPGMTLLESFENDSNQILNNARKDAAKMALASVKRTNAFRSMILAGSKGGDLNIFQIAVQVGQQNVNGRRIPFHFRRRTLPHYTKDDYLPQSRGLVKNGFVAGLTPFEFIFHTMGGREGLIDTACKTAETGYLQRKLIKSMEDVHVAYDGTVRNVTREVVQFMYGEDGLDGHRIEPNNKIDICKYDNAAMKKNFRYEYDDDGAFNNDFGGDYMTPELKRVLRSDKTTLGLLDEEFNNLMRDRDVMRTLVGELSDKVSIYLPVNVERLIHNTQAFYGVGRKSQQSSLDPRTIIENVSRLQKDILQLFASHSKRRTQEGHIVFDNKICEDRIRDAVRLFSIHVRTTLASKKVLKEYRLNETSFTYLVSEIRLKFMQSIVAAGETIGAIAAQSCGEPATQMTLNTFHNAGISSKNVTLGVPRLLELLNVSKHQRVSNMVIRLDSSIDTKQKAGIAIHLIESCTLLSLATSWSIVYDPDPHHSVTPADNEAFGMAWEVADVVPEMDFMSPWVARIELDALAIRIKSADISSETMTLIKNTLQAKLPEFVVEATSDSYVSATKQCLIRLRLRRRDDAVEPIGFLREYIPRILQTTHVKGVAGITKVFVQDRTPVVVDPVSGGLVKTVYWTLETEGTALRAVMSDVMNANGDAIVEPTATSSNNIPEINEVLGIEAARLKLLEEMREVYTGYDIRINYRQYSLLVDTMCHRGYLMAVSRTGINKIASVGPLMRCSFEETVNVLMGAAAFGEFDPVRGVSASVALGKQARIGTGIFDLVLNTDLLRDAVPQKIAIEVGRTEGVYAGASTVAYRRTFDAENAGGARATPLFDRSIAHGGAGSFFNNNRGGDSRSGNNNNNNNNSQSGTAGNNQLTGGTGGTMQSGGSGHGAVPSAPHYSAMMNDNNNASNIHAYGNQQGLLASSVYYNNNNNQGNTNNNNNINNNSMLMSSVAYANNNSSQNNNNVPQIFLPPGPSQNQNTRFLHNNNNMTQQNQQQSPAFPSSAYHPAQDMQSIPMEWTAQYGNRGAFTFDSAEYSTSSQQQGGGASGQSGGANSGGARSGGGGSGFSGSGYNTSYYSSRAGNPAGGGGGGGGGSASNHAQQGAGNNTNQPSYLRGRGSGSRLQGVAGDSTNHQQQNPQLGRAALAVAPVLDSAAYSPTQQQIGQQQQVGTLSNAPRNFTDLTQAGGQMQQQQQQQQHIGFRNITTTTGVSSAGYQPPQQLGQGGMSMSGMTPNPMNPALLQQQYQQQQRMFQQQQGQQQPQQQQQQQNNSGAASQRASGNQSVGSHQQQE